MKTLKTFENFSKEEIKEILQKAQKNSDIKINNIDNFLDKYMKPVERFGFNAIVREEARFLSEADYDRMGEYIEKFKALNIDTSKIEELYPKLVRYRKLLTLEDNHRYEYFDTKKEKEEAYEKIIDETDDLQQYVDQLKEEVKVLAKQAKELI